MHGPDDDNIRANVFYYYYYVCCVRRRGIEADGMAKEKVFVCECVAVCLRGRGVMATINCFARVNRLTVFMCVFR